MMRRRSTAGETAAAVAESKPDASNQDKPLELAMRALTMAALLGVLLALGAGAPAARADGDLQAAREELRLRVETERRMREEFETLLAGGRMSAEEIGDFEAYLTRLGEMVDAQRRSVAELAGEAADPPPPAALPADFERGRTDDEKLAMLDSELGRSLSEFDDKLLREQKEIAEKSRSTSDAAGGAGAESEGGASGDSAQGAGEAGEARGNDGEQGGEAPSAGGDQQAGSQEREADAPAPGESGREGDEGSNQVASAGGEDIGSGGGRPSPPPDIPDGADDDIVARQLREAAETEEDPELRAKLWEEYRKYKQGTR